MKNKYLKLFISTFSLSAFTFGGGYVIIPLMKRKFVDELGWIDEEEMLNYAAIAQSSPGAVAVNASVLVGYRVAGMAGALIAILGTVLPPLIIISVISMFYTAFRDNALVAAIMGSMRAGVAAVISNVALDMGGHVCKGNDALSIFIMATVFTLTYFLQVNAAVSILACAAIGIIRYMVASRKRVHAN